MSKYEEIQQSFALFQKARFEYRRDLENSVVRIRHALEAFLGLEEGKKDESGALYVDFGLMRGDKFEPCHARELPAEGLWIKFSIKVLVELAPSQHPKHLITIPVQLRRNASGYVVKLVQPGEVHEMQFSLNFDSEELELLSRELASIVQNVFDPAIFD
ncbi:hypothetical protein [Pseudomonas sp. AU12215]|uniref:hypothetical protein n=1 Tax=Pseudomonas sp. AU12215 TaxID=1860123 RepID=UPI0007EE5891|nr:hypothetical protein [Pseudomonas sp. AU12215]OBY48694.1 hypothetical protein A9513_032935 [Pseudomonas sp. AU12215]